MKKILTILLISSIFTVLISCESVRKLNANKKFAETVWIFKAKANIFSSPAIDSDGNIIFGTAGKGIFSLDDEGNVVWNYTRKNRGNLKNNKRNTQVNSFYSSPSIAEDGTIYIGSDKGELIALNPDGTQKWIHTLPNEIISTPAIGKDYLVVASKDKKVYAVSFQGEQIWHYEAKAAFTASPIIADNGMIYIGSEDGNCYSIYPDGTAKWVYGTSGKIIGGALLSRDQKTVYVANTAGAIFALNADTAQLVWFDDEFSSIFATPVKDADDNIIVVDNLGNIVKFSPKGEVLNSYDAPGGAFASPAITDKASIYVLTSDVEAEASYLTILRSDLTFVWRQSFTRDLRSSPTIADDGRLYFGSRLGRLYAISGLGEAPARNNGAMFASNRSHTGRYDMAETTDTQTSTETNPVLTTDKTTDKSDETQ